MAVGLGSPGDTRDVFPRVNNGMFFPPFHLVESQAFLLLLCAVPLGGLRFQLWAFIEPRALYPLSSHHVT